MKGNLLPQPTAKSVGAQPAFNVLPINLGGTGQQTKADALYALVYQGVANLDTDGQRCGLYLTQPGTAGTFPEGAGHYGIMLSLNTGNQLDTGYRVQLWLSITAPGAIWIRTRWDDGDWTTWYRYTGSAT